MVCNWFLQKILSIMSPRCDRQSEPTRHRPLKNNFKQEQPEEEEEEQEEREEEEEEEEE